MRHQICCITGHRPSHFSFGYDEEDDECVELKQRIRKKAEVYIKNGTNHFISGLGPGVEMYAAEIVLELKEKYPHIQLECALPFVAQSMEWSIDLRERHCRIILACDMKTIVNQEYFPTCYYERNKYMVNKASLISAVYDGSFSGTAQLLNYAEKAGKEIDIIPVE